MIIGTFTYDKASDVYRGDIRTLTLHLTDVELRPTTRKSQREPDYRVTAESGGAIVEFGAAWKRVSDNNREFVSIVLDDPALNGAFNAALFMRGDNATGANLVWTRSLPRPKPNELAQAPERPARPKPARSRARRGPQA